MEEKLPETLPLLEPKHLRPGDVLLSVGTNWIANLISTIDGSPYSHSSIWTGHGVAEAVEEGLRHWTLEESLTAHARRFVHVYRFNRKVPDLSPVAQSALAITEERDSYAWSELVLAGLVALSSQVPPHPSMREGIKLLISHFALVLRESQVPDLPRCMTCSQLVANSFARSESGGQSCALRIKITGHRQVRGATPLMGLPPDEGDDSLLLELEEVMKPLMVQFQQDSVSSDDLDPTRDSVRFALYAPGEYPPHLVSPRDLFSSPDLEPVGRLDPIALLENRDPGGSSG